MKHALVLLCAFFLSFSAVGQDNQAILSEAREHAKAGRVDDAFATLARAASPAPGIVTALSSSDEFSSLRKDARFRPLIERLQPCGSAEYRQFDFWLGDWEVRGPGGQLLGHNHISKRYGGCVVIEEWESAGGSSGSSFNLYDQNTKQWHQFWVDSSGTNWLSSDQAGNPNTQRGGFRDGAMMLASDPDTIPSIGLTRVSFRPLEDGRVHQVYESSTDGGKTWSVSFDGYYSRMKK
jgi:hypothetical protein